MGTLADSLRSWEARQAARLAASLKAAGDKAVQKIQAGCPVKSGELRSSIKADVQGGNSPKLTISAANYAKYIDQRTGLLAPLKDIPADVSASLKQQP